MGSMHGLSAANPRASLFASDSTPDPGQTITITGSYSDSDGNLSAATIRNLGSGNKTGNTGSFPSIGSAGESISGSRDSITRSFTFPSTTASGTYTFRTEVVDTTSGSAIAWKTVTVQSVSSNSNPTVSISASSTTLTEGGSVTVTATANDTDGTIQSVSFRRNGRTIATDNTAPYVVTFRSLSAGTHRFEATAVDNDGGTATSNTVTVTVNAAPSNANPTVSISASATSITEGGSVTVTASDSDGTIQSVTFRRNGSTVKTDTSRPYTYTYSSASRGTHSFQATATDNDGGTKTSNTVTVRVTPRPNVNPTVSISASRTTLIEGGSVTVTATASDTDGTIESVTFRRNGSTVKTDTISPYSYTYRSASVGTHSFQATATDNDGGTGTSNTVG